MTRINTNVSSLIAQNQLARSNSDLQVALERLSTGLRINSGKDDPAGLIASEALRSDITAVRRAISNSERANELISTADSALGEVNKLLNDIRGLVTEAANTGSLSDDQLAANQLQVDSSLEAIDRIAGITSFQGRKLIDGTLDFNVESVANANFDRISNLQISQANLGSAGPVGVDVNVETAATQAQVDIDVPAATTAANAFNDVALTNTIDQASLTYTLAGSGFQFSVAADAGGIRDGAVGSTFNVEIIDNAAGTATINGTTIEVRVDLATATAQDVVDAINTDLTAEFDAAIVADGALAAGDDIAYGLLLGGRDAGSASIRVTADTAGSAANGVSVTLAESALNPLNNTALATIDGNGDIDVAIRGTVTYSDIATAIDGLSGYSAAINAGFTGDQDYIDTLDAPPAAVNLGSGADAAGGLTQDVVFELAGQDGREVFSFEAGSTAAQIESAIDLLSDTTGVEATINGSTLELTSVLFGSNALVEVAVISEAAGGTVTAAVGQLTRNTGLDVEATVNGILATGDGNSLSINTSTLDLSLEVDANFTGTVEFDITGGGALFQLGPQVVTNQQARLGIGSVSTARLGGSSGRLYELRTGGTAALATDSASAAKIVDEVITKVTSLRGRLGAFQRQTVDSNIKSLNDTLSSLTASESAIRDADFAVESAQLTRAQILVQSGTSVLGIANSNPQNVLALLR